MGQLYATYAGFTFPYSSIAVTQQPIFAMDGLQLEYFHTQITISGWLTLTSEEQFSQTLIAMRGALNQSQQDFAVGFTDSNAKNNPAFTLPAKYDTKFGPIPGQLRMHEFRGGLSMAYSWSLQAHTRECISYQSLYPPNGQSSAVDPNIFIGTGTIGYLPASAILSNVFNQTTHIDLNGFQSAVISGVLTVSSAAITAGYTADAYRYAVAPVATPFFQIQSQSYQLSPDGTTLTYNLVYDEKMYTLPLPISSGHATYAVNIRHTGMIAGFSLTGRFGAPRSVTKTVILQRIGALLTAKLGAFLTNKANPAIFEQQDLQTSVYDNEVAFNFQGFFSIGTDQDKPVTPADYTGANSTFVQPDPLSITGTAQNATPYGNFISSNNALLPKVKLDDCTDNKILTGLQPFTPVASNQGGFPLTKFVILPNSTAKLAKPPAAGTSGVTPVASPGHLSSPYVEYIEMYSYELDTGFAIFIPKSAGPVIAQRARQPRVRLIQSGSATRVVTNTATDLPQPPPPTFLAASKNGVGVVLKAIVKTHSPTPAYTGQFSYYKVSWTYVQEFTSATIIKGFAESSLLIPSDPRVLASTLPNGKTSLGLDTSKLVMFPPTS